MQSNNNKKLRKGFGAPFEVPHVGQTLSWQNPFASLAPDGSRDRGSLGLPPEHLCRILQRQPAMSLPVSITRSFPNRSHLQRHYS